MSKMNKLEIANMNYGNYCLNVYDSSKNRRTPVAVAEQLLQSVTRSGGIVEDILMRGDNGVLGSEAINEINQARYLARLMYDNSLCSRRSVSKFMKAADVLIDAIANPEPPKKDAQKKTTKKVKKQEAAVADQPVRKKRVVDDDPDGFDDLVDDPAPATTKKAKAKTK